jgi:transposase
MKYFLGIDVSADCLDYCLLDYSGDGVTRGDVPNSKPGIRRLLSVLPEPKLACVVFESTGIYGKRLCVELPGQVGMTCEVNPKLIKNAASSMTATKTDKVDARAIAAAARALMLTQPRVLERAAMTGEENHDLDLWLGEYGRLRRAFVRLQRQRGLAMLSLCGTSPELVERHDRELEQLKKSKAEAKARVEDLASGEDFDLVFSIKGIGALTAAALVSKIKQIERFDTADQLKAYFGLYPCIRQSGKRKGQARMAQHGNAMIRDLLWNCAKPAAVHNPACKALYERLRAKGKPAPYAWAAVARKLLQIVHGVLTTRTPWDGRLGVPQLASTEGAGSRVGGAVTCSNHCIGKGRVGADATSSTRGAGHATTE